MTKHSERRTSKIRRARLFIKKPRDVAWERQEISGGVGEFTPVKPSGRSKLALYRIKGGTGVREVFP